MARAHHAKPWHDNPITAAIARYQTPGPGPSSGIPKRDLELSKIERQVEDIRAILHSDASWLASEIRVHLTNIELSTRYLKEHA